jgi:outer membrane protein assembly factor BamD
VRKASFLVLAFYGSASLWCAAALTGCATTQKTGSYAENARLAYEEAMEAFEDDDCITAEPLFRDIRANYPYTRYAALAELREADCLSQEEKYAEAIEIYQRFARVRASHEDVPYARFKAAESQYKQIPTEWFLSPPSHERDVRSARDALKDLRRFLLDFPYDERAAQAQKMEKEVLALLAQHELYVAEFYLKREHPAAAVHRLNYLLETYEGSGYEPHAYLLMGRTLLFMKKRPEAHAAFRELIAKYPQSGSAVQAERYLAETGG